MSNPREYIGKVTLTDGDVIDIYMPTMGDFIMGSLRGLNTWEIVIPAATGRTIDWFYQLSLPDGTAIVEKLTAAFDLLNDLVRNLNKDRKK